METTAPWWRHFCRMNVPVSRANKSVFFFPIHCAWEFFWDSIMNIYFVVPWGEIRCGHITAAWNQCSHKIVQHNANNTTLYNTHHLWHRFWIMGLGFLWVNYFTVIYVLMWDCFFISWAFHSNTNTHFVLNCWGYFDYECGLHLNFLLQYMLWYTNQPQH